jgi:hypothetical protein
MLSQRSYEPMRTMAAITSRHMNVQPKLAFTPLNAHF